MIVPIVEGQSEDRALGVLVRRLAEDRGASIGVARPFRVKRQRVVRPTELERSLKQAIRSRVGATAVILVLDADSDCPAELGAQLLTRAKAETHLPARVVLPKVEIESWVLAGLESVRGVCGIRMDAAAPHDAESVRDAKGALTRSMEPGRGYVGTDDLPAFFARLDLLLVEQRSRSFRKFRQDILSLIAD